MNNADYILQAMHDRDKALKGGIRWTSVLFAVCVIGAAILAQSWAVLLAFVALAALLDRVQCMQTIALNDAMASVIRAAAHGHDDGA